MDYEDGYKAGKADALAWQSSRDNWFDPNCDYVQGYINGYASGELERRGS